jgi:uncharacterized membrane protein
MLDSSSESHLRSVAKGVSYRLVGTLLTTMLSFVLTGSARTAMFLGSAEITFKVLLFWGHERVWAKVQWGRHHGRAPRDEDRGWLRASSAALRLRRSEQPLGAVQDGADVLPSPRPHPTVHPPETCSPHEG